MGGFTLNDLLQNPWSQVTGVFLFLPLVIAFIFIAYLVCFSILACELFSLVEFALNFAVTATSCTTARMMLLVLAAHTTYHIDGNINAFFLRYFKGETEMLKNMSS